MLGWIDLLNILGRPVSPFMSVSCNPMHSGEPNQEGG